MAAPRRQLDVQPYQPKRCAVRGCRRQAVVSVKRGGAFTEVCMEHEIDRAIRAGEVIGTPEWRAKHTYGLTGADVPTAR